MDDFIIEKILATQTAFLSSHNAKNLITTTSDFFSIIFQPQSIFFCIGGEQLHYLAEHISGMPIHHFTISPKNLMTDINHEKLWELATQKKTISPYLSMTHLKINNNNEKESWYCLKQHMLKNEGLFIFLQDPNNEMIKLWESEPLLSALLMQFFHLLQHFRERQSDIIKLINHAKQEDLYLQEIQQQQAFSSKILKLHEVTQALISSSSLDSLYKNAVETLRTMLDFDRTALILADLNQHLLYPVYGTDIEGNTVDENTMVYDMETLSSQMQQAVLQSEKHLEVIEDTPLYNNGKIVGVGWNAIVILRDGEELIGWIAIDNLLNHKTLLSYERKLLILYSRILSKAIIQKREENNTKLLYAPALQLTYQTTELDICKVAVEITREKLKVDRASIFLSYDNGKTIFGTFGTDDKGQLTDETHFHEPLTKHSLLTSAMSNPDKFTFEESIMLFQAGKIVGHGWNAALLLHNKSQVIGFLVFDNLINKHVLTNYTKELLILFTSDLAEIITRKRAEESVYRFNIELEQLVEKRTAELANVNNKLEESNKKLAQLSYIDSLTGIANRRHFDKTYPKAWAKACSKGENLSVVMLDIDYFKAYNDHYGHQKGDECLKEVAQLIQKHFQRENEIVARYGGEEFIILLPQSSTIDINRRVQAILDVLFTLNIMHDSSPLQRVTLSAGFASLNIHKNMLPSKLIKWADEALYQAKSKGRNTVINRQTY